MLGKDLAAAFRDRKWDVEAPAPERYDLTSAEDAARLALGQMGRFDWVVNAAAYTAVDKAESDRDACFLVNAIGPSYLAKAAASVGAQFLQFSTDFVFDGEKTDPYTEDDAPNPIGIYAKSKLEGELAVQAACPGALIVRTAWLFGPNGKSFPRTILKAYLAGNALRVVDDQIGSPTYTEELARTACNLIELGASGVIHAVGPEIKSWHQFAVEVLETFRQLHPDAPDAKIEPISTIDWPTPAARPKYSALATLRLKELSVSPMEPTTDSLLKFVRRLPEI